MAIKFYRRNYQDTDWMLSNQGNGKLYLKSDYFPDNEDIVDVGNSIESYGINPDFFRVCYGINSALMMSKIGFGIEADSLAPTSPQDSTNTKIKIKPYVQLCERDASSNKAYPVGAVLSISIIVILS